MQDTLDRIIQQWRHARPELDPSAMGIFGRLTRAERLAGRRIDGRFSTRQLDREEFDVLATLRRTGAPYRLTPSELSRSLLAECSSGTMTGRLDRLARMGFIERLPHPTDRRGVLITLTPHGIHVTDELVDSLLEVEAGLLSALSAEERRQLAGLLRKLLIAIERDS